MKSEAKQDTQNQMLVPSVRTTPAKWLDSAEEVFAYLQRTTGTEHKTY